MITQRTQLTGPKRSEYIQNRLKAYGLPHQPCFPVATGKKFINIFEMHDQNVSNQVALQLADAIHATAIALEQPIARMAFIKNADYSGSGNRYAASLKNLCETAQEKKIDIICIDTDPGILKYEVYTEEVDRVREEIMAHFLYHFTPAKRIITINGLAHKKLLHKLTNLDSEAMVCPIIININAKYTSPAIKKVEVKLNQNAYPKINVDVPDEKTVLDSSIIKQIIDLIPDSIKQYEQHEIFRSPPPLFTSSIFKSPLSADAMLLMPKEMDEEKERDNRVEFPPPLVPL